MAQLEAVNNQKHKTLSVDATKVDTHSAGLNLIPVVVAEFAQLALQCPIVLTKHSDTGQFVFAAMCGFEKGENLFYENQQWQGLYVPLQIQRQPFFLGEPCPNHNKNTPDYSIYIDTQSPTIVTDADAQNAHRLFTENGQESDFFHNAKLTLAHILQGEKDNLALLELLTQFELIQSVSIDVIFINDQKTALNGLYTIDQEKLAQLNAEQVCSLHQQGVLKSIYAMIISLGQVYALVARKNAGLSR